MSGRYPQLSVNKKWPNPNSNHTCVLKNFSGQATPPPQNGLGDHQYDDVTFQTHSGMLSLDSDTVLL